MIKSYTDLEQSKVLSQILPFESADMWWSRCTITDFGDGTLKVSYAVEPCNISQFRNTREDIPCWSLASLLNVLPEPYQLTSNKEDKVQLMLIHHLEKDYYDNPVDACVAMIEKLHELKML